MLKEIEKLSLRTRWLLGGGTACGMILLGLLLFFLLKGGREVEPPLLQAEETFVTSQSSNPKIAETLVIYADIKGAVKNPGMYKLSENTRLLDLVDLAGGFLEEADTSQVNYSQVISDQMVVYIPKNGETIPDTLAPTGSGNQHDRNSEENDAGGKVNLNTANLSELQTINGIGPKKAEAIIAHRQAQGSFNTIEELKNVKGIGEKTFEVLKEYLTIE